MKVADELVKGGTRAAAGGDHAEAASPPGGTGARAGVGPPVAGAWRVAGRTLDLATRPLVMGVLNVTPDSFWDGGRHRGVDRALAQFERLLEEGADMVDVGGESTRPGAAPVSEDEELGRVVPVLEAALRRWPDAVVSVDTVKSAVARAAVEAGAAALNDVSALRLDPTLARVAASAGAGLVLMHSRGGLAEMALYETARYGDDVVGEVVAELDAARRTAREAGVPDEAIVLDPGLGFSKRTEHSVAVLAGVPRLLELGRPVLVGPSRKRFVGELSGGLPAEERLPGTIAACVAALFRGARLFRVHDVAPVRHALDVAEAVWRGG